MRLLGITPAAMSDPPAPAPGGVRECAVPPAARARCTLAHIDYEDAFRAEAFPAQDRTGEQWARAMLESASQRTRSELSRGWSALGLRLDCAPPDRSVLGWEIRHSTPDFVLLGARGRLGLSGELLFERQPHGLVYATFVQLDNRVARALWTRIEARHRRVVRDLIERACYSEPAGGPPEAGRPRTRSR
jgi:hypothetical protein